MLRLEKSSSLRHIMSMCTDFLKANNGMMRTLAGTKLGVSCLESCLHQGVMQKLLVERQGVAYMCCCLCQRRIPNETFHQRRNERGKGKC